MEPSRWGQDGVGGAGGGEGWLRGPRGSCACADHGCTDVPAWVAIPPGPQDPPRAGPVTSVLWDLCRPTVSCYSVVLSWWHGHPEIAVPAARRGDTPRRPLPQGCSWRTATGSTPRCSPPGSTSWPAPSVSTGRGGGAGALTPPPVPSLSLCPVPSSWSWAGANLCSPHSPFSHFSMIVVVFLFSCLLFFFLPLVLLPKPLTQGDISSFSLEPQLFLKTFQPV